ncbi:MAG: TetR/AcrR family transcriptional regulator [Deltaproteobacteria bacterium]|nr:TetR/AcrR family transcriptional regulator [Deltaproteobacteria bacterium]MBW2414447.1 TetR/AcrR family transcriptional regulator [Deltaproteobacteria bacterium]
MTPDDGASEGLPADGTLLTARGVRSRAALLAAARHLFESKGYANTKIADITEEAGRALGSFYTYFANKEEVLEQMAEDFKSEIDGRLTELDLTSAEPYDVIRNLVSVYWSSCRDHSAELAAIFQASMLDPRFAQRWREIRSDARKNIAAGIRAVGQAGLVQDPDPEATASALGSMMDYFCYVWLIEGGEADRSSLPDDVAIDTMARVFYRTVFAAPEPAPGPGKQ